jgi:hypothetical protein
MRVSLSSNRGIPKADDSRRNKLHAGFFVQVRRNDGLTQGVPLGYRLMKFNNVLQFIVEFTLIVNQVALRIEK